MEFFQTIVVTILSGAFSAFILFLIGINRERKTKKHLTDLLFFEISVMHRHINQHLHSKIVPLKKEDWLRTPLALSLNLTLFENRNIQNAIVSLETTSVFDIVSYYNFYKAIEVKLKNYAIHLNEKTALQNDSAQNLRVQSLTNLVIELTLDLKAEVESFNGFWESISKSDDFIKWNEKYNK